MQNTIEKDIKAENEIRGICEEIRRLPKLASGKVKGGMPKGLRSRILEVWEKTDLSYDELGKKIGITGSGIQYWKKQMKGKGFRRVQVAVGPQPKTVMTQAPSSGLTLELPGGARVIGLTLEQVRMLVTGGGL